MRAMSGDSKANGAVVPGFDGLQSKFGAAIRRAAKRRGLRVEIRREGDRLQVRTLGVVEESSGGRYLARAAVLGALGRLGRLRAADLVVETGLSRQRCCAAIDQLRVAGRVVVEDGVCAIADECNGE